MRSLFLSPLPLEHSLVWLLNDFACERKIPCLHYWLHPNLFTYILCFPVDVLMMYAIVLSYSFVTCFVIHGGQQDQSRGCGVEGLVHTGYGLELCLVLRFFCCMREQFAPFACVAFCRFRHHCWRKIRTTRAGRLQFNSKWNNARILKTGR
jgi:hypothetical protein